MRRGKSFKSLNSLLGVSMRLTYDKEADAVYIELKEGSFATNKQVADNTILDLDTKGNVLGIELLDASSRIDLAIDLDNLRIKA